jgi:hypothetical protein
MAQLFPERAAVLGASNPSDGAAAALVTTHSLFAAEWRHSQGAAMV